jgi:hypothetical protein
VSKPNRKEVTMSNSIANVTSPQAAAAVSSARPSAPPAPEASPVPKDVVTLSPAAKAALSGPAQGDKDGDAT